MSGAMIPMPVDDPLQSAWLDTNDLGNAERLVRLAKGQLLWVDDLGWVGYDGRRWSARDGERMATKLAHDVARHIDAEAMALNEIAEDVAALERAFGWAVPVEVAKDRVIALRKHAVKSGNATATAAMLKQAQTLISARREEFDTDPLALNVANGTIRFAPAEGGGWEARHAPHDPTDRMMQMAAFVYDKDAACPDWRERMELVQPNREQRRLMQMVYGYILTGLTSEQKWFIFQGRGGDGKSLTNDVIARLMGDYYRHAGVETFLQSGTQKSGSEHSSDLARLQGDIRLVTCDEPTARSTWNGTRLKQVTGSLITCRAMHKAEIEYKAHWKLIVEVNPLPAVPTDDDGFWRRVVAIPWSYQFDKGGQASVPFEQLADHFVNDEGSGILNWMIAGALKWLETRRLPISEESATFTRQYRQSVSTMGEWYMECCEVGDREALTPSGDLYASFKQYCENAGAEKVPSQTALGRWLRDKQHEEKKDRTGKRLRKGIRLREGAPLSAAPDRADAPDPANPNSGVDGRGAPQAPASNWRDDDDDFGGGWPE
jgi:putative DNA primase/helicase